MNSLQKFVQEDLEFARRTDEAWQEIDEGKCTRVKLEDLDGVWTVGRMTEVNIF